MKNLKSISYKQHILNIIYLTIIVSIYNMYSPALVTNYNYLVLFASVIFMAIGCLLTALANKNKVVYYVAYTFIAIAVSSVLSFIMYR